MRRFLILLMLLSLLLVPTMAQAQERPIRLFVGNSEVQSDVAPVLEGGRTLVPLRALSVALGFQVTWEEASQTATLTKGSLTIQLTAGKQEALVNGKVVALDVPAAIRGGRMMIPVRFVSEQLQAKVTWDGENQVVNVALPAAELIVTPPENPVNPPETTTSQIDPQILALLKKSEEYANIKATGEFTMTILGPMGSIPATMSMEMYAKGEQEQLVLTSVNLFNMTQKSGTALHLGQAWVQNPMTGLWEKLEMPEAAAAALENPANYAQINEEMLKIAKVTQAEQRYEGTLYDVITITMDLEAMAQLGSEQMPEGVQGSLKIVAWLEKETARTHHVDLQMSMSMPAEQGSMELAGTMFMEAWEEAIPFPAEILK